MKKKFTSLFTTNFFGVMNDNYLKAVASFLAVKWVDASNAPMLISSVAAALVLPYLVLSPLAGSWAQLYDKRKIIVWAKIAEIPIIIIAIIGFIYKSPILVVLSILFMGIQSALFSPAKYGLIRDIGGDKELSFGVGGMEAISFLGILSGMLIAAFLVDTTSNFNIIYFLFALFAILGLIASLTIKRHYSTENIEERISTNPIKSLVKMYKAAKKYKNLNTIIFVLSVFWWLAALLQIGLLSYCTITLKLSSWNTGIILSMAAVGITIGCFLSGLIFNKNNKLMSGLVSGFLLSLLLIIIFFTELSPLLFGIAIFGIATLSGFFKVPLDSALQRIAKGNFLPLALAYFNQVSFIFILLSSLSLTIISLFFELKYMFLLLGVVMLITTIVLLFKVQSILLNFVLNLLRIRYKIKVKGLEILDDKKNYLFMPNHVAVIDPIMIFCTFYNIPIRPFVDENYVNSPVIGNVIRNFNAIAVPDMTTNRSKLKQAQLLESSALEALNEGDNILLYPSGMITTNGIEHIGNKQLAYNIAKSLPENTQVIAINIKGLWGSRFSRYGRSSTPDIIATLLSSFGLLLRFKKRRAITITLYDITDDIKEWRNEERQEFNKKLEVIYNN